MENRYGKTKEERRQWWFALTPEEQQDYIQRQQHKKMECRMNTGGILREDQAHLDSIKQEVRE